MYIDKGVELIKFHCFVLNSAFRSLANNEREVWAVYNPRARLNT